MHLAAEQHVNRSFDGQGAFLETNTVGTFYLLNVAPAYWRDLPKWRKLSFRFYHILTDEVFDGLPFDS